MIVSIVCTTRLEWSNPCLSAIPRVIPPYSSVDHKGLDASSAAKATRRKRIEISVRRMLTHIWMIARRSKNILQEHRIPKVSQLGRTLAPITT